VAQGVRLAVNLPSRARGRANLETTWPGRGGILATTPHQEERLRRGLPLRGAAPRTPPGAGEGAEQEGEPARQLDPAGVPYGAPRADRSGEDSLKDPAPHRITISQRSRPLRFGYLLRGFYDDHGFRAGIRLFTSLWGGMYNCFIPVYRRRPGWWRGSQSGQEITRGYVDAFEPDFLIAENSELADEVDYDTNRILMASDLIRQDQFAPFSHGIGVHELFGWMWKKDYQYVKRTPPEIVVPQAAERRFGALVAACFGEYPSRDDRRPDFEAEFKRVFDARDLPVSAEEFMRLNTEPVGYPLDAGRADLEVPRRGGPMGRLVFFLDPGSTQDLVDFWNLRAYGMSATVVPLPWFDELKHPVRALVHAGHRPHPMQPERMLWTTALSAQSHDPRGLKALLASLEADPPTCIQPGSYPRIWAKAPRFVYRPRRGRIVASRGEAEVTLRGEHIHFQGCSLPFKPLPSPQRKADSVRVIRLRDWSGLSGVAAAFPPDLKSVNTVVQSFPKHEVWSSSEGIVTTCEGAEPRFYWKLPKSRDVCRAWLRQHGFAFEMASAGELLEAAVRRLGGLHGAWLLASEDLVRLLNRMAGRGDRPAKTYEGSRLVEEIEKTTGDRGQAISILHRLIRSRVLQLGAEIQCAHCRQHNWYRVKRLSVSLHCHRCLRDFSFPIEHPQKKISWRYRTIGPFAVENYIMGGIPVLLALPILGGGGGSLSSAGITWCPSFKLKRNGVDWAEIDALAIVEQSGPQSPSALAVFVEAKSYGGKGEVFSSKDATRMRKLAKRFPGAVLVFATLSPKLTRAEKDLILPLARAGREPIGEDDWKNPVVVLTGQELFSEAGPPYCWDGIHEAADVRQGFWSPGGLLGLADATQQLYLDMESYDEYISRWIENRRLT